MSAGFTNGVVQAEIGQFSGCKTVSAGFSFSAPTIIQQSFVADYGVVAGNSASRINFTDLTTTISNRFTVSTVDLTVIIPGTYFVSCIFTPTVTATSTQAVIQINKNGSPLGAGVTDIVVATIGSTGASTSNTAMFAVGDTIDFRILSVGAGTYNLLNFDVTVLQIATGT